MTNIPTAPVNPNGPPVDVHFVVTGLVASATLLELYQPGQAPQLLTPAGGDTASSNTYGIPNPPNSLQGWNVVCSTVAQPLPNQTICSVALTAYQNGHVIGYSPSTPVTITGAETITEWLLFI